MPAKVHCGGLFLGDTIQEKTRTLLGWSDEHCPTITVKSQKYPETTQKSVSRCDRRMLHVNNSRPHPYMIPVGRLRRYSASSSSTCSSSSSEYSQPSPSYSITSYESLSPEPLVSPYTATDCQSPHLVPLGPTIPATTARASTTYRSPEREAQVFERLRQLVPMLPFDRSAYQVLIETVSQVMDLEQQLEQLNEQTNSAKNSLWIEQRSLVSDAENSVFPDDLKTVDVTAFKRLLCSNPLSGDTSKTVHFNFVL
uniref:BHLH domain-containing protein n=1 Tax=Elaeophora elaphi TaxID=1147741 RepID=A0A0R3RH02_9BILA